MTSASDVLQMIKDNDVKFVDLRLTDTLGKEMHVTVPADCIDEDVFELGQPFDGSSFIGWRGIEASDMLLMPDPDSARMDPFREVNTLILQCNVHEPKTGKDYDRDPRSLGLRAEAYLKSTGIGDTAYFGPEPEFFIFDKVRFENSMQRSFYEVDSIEAPWNSGVDTEDDGTPNIAFKNRVKRGYFPVPPIDHTQDLRDDMVANLQKVGLILERSHHEVAGAGQQEINYRFNSLQHAGDDLMKYKYVVHETAALAGKAATFMPKPIAGDNGTGMHCHQSLWKDGKPLFYDEKNYGGLSDLARWYIGGLIKHSSSVLAFTNPSLNSYHRLVPGFEAPVNLVYSARNRSAAIRIPLAGTSPAAKRIEFRAPDPSCNPFLAFSAQLMAGLDGILNHIEPPEPVDKDLYELPPEEHAGIKQVPSSLAEAMDALEEDHDFLTAGDVFTDDLIETWIGIKRGEIDQARLAPTPLEYELYFHI